MWRVIHAGIGPSAQVLWLSLLFQSDCHVIDDSWRTEWGSISPNVDTLFASVGLLALHKERQLLWIFWLKSFSLIKFFAKKSNFIFYGQNQVGATLETDIALLPTQNIHFNVCCLRKSKGYPTPSHTDSSPLLVPFVVDIRACVGNFDGLIIITLNALSF